MKTVFAELGAASNFSFLRGASHAEEMVIAAAALGLAGLSIADRNTLAGVVRGHLAAKEVGLKYAVGCRLTFTDEAPDILAWPTDRAAYGRLCRLLTLGNMRGEKDDCRLTLEDLAAWCRGLVLAPIAATGTAESLARTAHLLREAASEPVRLAVTRPYGRHDQRLLLAHAQWAKDLSLRPLATNLPLYHAPARRPLHDVVTAIREHTTLDKAGRLLEANAERHLKSAAEMARLLDGMPSATAESLAVMEGLRFSLEELRYEYPEEPTDPGRTPQETLERLTADGARRRYRDGVPARVQNILDHELRLIAELDYAPYFLTVYDVVRFAREKNILAQGRGSAANSSVCYCLGITEVDPEQADLLFERFISPERREPPDIDVDFEHERREEVIQYIYDKYGRERAGIAATVITYRSRSAAREIGKALGLSEDAVGAVSGNIWGWSSNGVQEGDVTRAGLSPQDPRIGHLMQLSQEIAGFPRHLSQHVGGFVITRGRLDELVPILKAAMDERTNIEWDKDDLDALGILKIDVLALGMLTCLRKGLALLAAHYAVDFKDRARELPAMPRIGERQAEGVPQYAEWPVTLATIPPNDADTYDMICRADTLGVFQIESRAQMTMLPRLRPRTFYDLVIEVAIVRPGPIQGDMVHPYLRRRQGKEDVSYPSEALRAVLEKTLGVPLFQEQCMKIAIVGAGFSPAEADQLRRAMATFRKVGTIGTFRDKLIDGMAANGYERDFAERCFKQIEGFGEYGFPESHAASFALLVYASCWLKCHYPDVFCAALLNSQPMGFYAPAQIVRDARRHGVEVRPVDVNLSDWDNRLEPGPEAAAHLAPEHGEMVGAIRSHHAVRLGFRQAKGLREDDLRTLVAHRGAGYDSVRDLWLRTGLTRAVIERLADADAFGSLGLSRRDALWAARGLDQDSRPEDLPLFAAADDLARALQREAAATLPPMPPGEEVINDYRFLSLSLKAHPAAFVRRQLAADRIVPCETLITTRSNAFVSVAGLILVRQRPGSAKGVIFVTLEDETGIANIIVWPKTFEVYRQAVLAARFIAVWGRVQNEDGVIHIVADRLEDRTAMLTRLTDGPSDWDTLDRADEVRRPVPDIRIEAKPRSRLKRLVDDSPELRGDLDEMLANNRMVADAVAAHRAAAERISAGQHGPAPRATWFTARTAARDLSQLGRNAKKAARAALPKGRNFH